MSTTRHTTSKDAAVTPPTDRVPSRVELYRRLPATEDVSWWRQLATLAPGRTVLYVGCGTGRLAVPLAEVSDRLVGVDVDPEMLAAFGRRVEGTEIADRVDLVEAEAEDLDLGEQFGLVVLPSSLLNGIVDPSARVAAARGAARHCRDDGTIVLQVLNPYWMACQDPSSRGRLHPAADAGAPVDVSIRQQQFDAWEQRQLARITYRFADGAELSDDVDAVALYPRELRALAYQAGMRIVERWGARPGQDELTLDGGSWHLVCVPER